jgi:hypothetical protein
MEHRFEIREMGFRVLYVVSPGSQIIKKGYAAQNGAGKAEKYTQ